MAARDNLWRSMSKFINNDKPAAILTAFRADFSLKKNRSANSELEDMFNDRGLSFYPVDGVGEEEDEEGGLKPVVEESYIVQPIGEMEPDTFVNHIRELLFSAHNPDHRQWGAVVKLPNEPPWMLHHGGSPSHPGDYNPSPMTPNARIRSDEPYYTRLKKDRNGSKSFVVGDME